MIARKIIPPEHEEWNKKWGAPGGYQVERSLEYAHRFADDDPKRYGPFGFQRTSHTRTQEYPWAYFTAELKPGMRVVDVGGWLSGFQVVLAGEGCDVVNVDPSVPQDERWTIDHKQTEHGAHERLHKQFTSMFDVDVNLVTQRIQDVDLPANSIDRIFAISVIEHVEQGEAREMLDAMGRLLAPGGLALLSIDIFFDIQPFGVLPRNYWGRNTDVHQLLDGCGLDMIEGDPKELLGFPEFDRDRVVENIAEYNIGHRYPVASQLVVLRKP